MTSLRASEQQAIPPAVAAGCISILCLVWGSTWHAIKFGLEDVPPFTAAAARFAIAAMVMAAVVVPLFGTREGGSRPPLWLSASVGSMQFFCSYSIVYWSEQHLPGALVAVLWATFPLMMAWGGRTHLGEPLRPVQAIGFAFGFAGVVALFLTDLVVSGTQAVVAAFILLLSPLVTTVSTIILKKHGSGFSSLRINRDGMVVGAVLLTLAAWLTENDADVQWTTRAIGIVLYLSLLGTCLTFGLYFWLMRRMSASRLSLVAFANPCVAVILGTLIGEPITAWTIAGSSLVVMGVVLVVKPGRR